MVGGIISYALVTLDGNPVAKLSQHDFSAYIPAAHLKLFSADVWGQWIYEKSGPDGMTGVYELQSDDARHRRQQRPGLDARLVYGHPRCDPHR
jgi:hypothetical protein